VLCSTSIHIYPYRYWNLITKHTFGKPSLITIANSKETIQLFRIDENELNLNLNINDESIISFIKIRRDEKHSYFIKQGQNLILSNRFEEAKESFLKARNYIENAETLTLLAWAYSLLDSNEMAKNIVPKLFS